MDTITSVLLLVPVLFQEDMGLCPWTDPDGRLSTLRRDDDMKFLSVALIKPHPKL